MRMKTTYWKIDVIDSEATMSKASKKAERKQMMVRIVSLVLAGLMIFSAVIAAVLAQVY